MHSVFGLSPRECSMSSRGGNIASMIFMYCSRPAVRNAGSSSLEGLSRLLFFFMFKGTVGLILSSLFFIVKG